jgi:hypothetical protein
MLKRRIIRRTSDTTHHRNTPNVVVEWLTLLLSILEVTGSILSSDIGYPEWGFSWFLTVPPGECRDSTLKFVHDCFLPNNFQFIIHLSSYHRRYIVQLQRMRL